MLNQFVHRLVGFCIRYRAAVFAAAALITAVLAWAALRLEIDADVTNLLPSSLKVVELTEKFGRSRDSGELLVSVRSDDVFSLEGLAALERAIRRISEHELVTGAIHPFNLICFEGSAGKLRITPSSPCRSGVTVLLRMASVMGLS